MKILIVEDDQAFFGLCSMELKNAGHDVVHVADGSQALEKIKVEKPDVVLLDIVLPGMNGLDILKEMKDLEETKNIKVAMLTNFGMDDNVNRAMELGANDYLMKYNIVLSELPAKISSLGGTSKETKDTIKVTS